MTFSPTVYLQKKLFNYSKSKIIAGYFKELIYETNEGLSFPIIAGTYEKELFPILTQLESYDNLIVIGAGDGYYAVGLMSKYVNLKLFAFEILPERKVNLLHNLKLNNIDKNRFFLYDGASVSNLASTLDKLNPNDKNLIIIDVEGYEKVLLNPSLIPKLNQCTILVELHDHLIPGVSEELKERFQSHRISIFTTSKRTVKDIKQPFNIVEKLIFKKQLTRLLGEGRGVEMEWFYLEPK